MEVMVERHPEESTGMFFLGWLSFIPAGLVIWALYDVLMLLIGGRSIDFGTSWKQWNYVR